MTRLLNGILPPEVTWKWDAPLKDIAGRPLTGPLTYEIEANGQTYPSAQPCITLPLTGVQIVRVRAKAGGGWSAWSEVASVNMPVLSIAAGSVGFVAMSPVKYKLLHRTSLTEGDWEVVWQGVGFGQPVVLPLSGDRGFFKLTAELNL